MTDLDLDAIRARCDVATPGPWEPGCVWGHAGVLPERFGPDKCAYCDDGPPVWSGRREINGRWMLAHRHRLRRPYHPDSDISSDGGALLGSLYEPADQAFVVAAREDVPALLAEVERLRALIAANPIDFTLADSDAEWAVRCQLQPDGDTFHYPLDGAFKSKGAAQYAITDLRRANPGFKGALVHRIRYKLDDGGTYLTRWYDEGEVAR